MVDYIAACKDWVNNFVVKENLCPFAKEPLEAGLIDWERVRSVEFLADTIDQFFNSTYKSKFLILPFLENFKDFLDLADFAQHLVDVLGYSEDIKLVFFHPLNQYAETEIEDPVNYANRAPYASIQLLRNKDLLSLNMTDEWKAQILDRNASHLKKLGKSHLIERFDEFRK